MIDSAEMQYIEQRKNPTVAVLLSFVFSGAGQIYNGEVGKGLAMIIGCVFCLIASSLVLPLFILFGIWVWGMVDANTKAKEINAALKSKFETAKATADQQERLRTTTITSLQFVEQIDKCFRLFQNSLLSEAEFSEKKKIIIMMLSAKSRIESPEDFLTSVIPLIQKKALTEEEIAQIKTAVL